MSIGIWAQSNDPKTESAKRRIESLPLSKTGHGKKVPFPYASRTAYKDIFTNEEINHAINSAPVKIIRIAGLHAIQHSVRGDRVEEYIKHPNLLEEGQRSPKHKGLIDLPIVVQYRGIRYIHDGHHRTTAEWALGHNKVEARFVDLDHLHQV